MAGVPPAGSLRSFGQRCSGKPARMVERRRQLLAEMPPRQPQDAPTLVRMDQPQLDLGQADPFDADTLERPPSQQVRIYEEMRRQAIWAFNFCCVFAGLGVVQGLVGLIGVFSNPKIGLSLLASGGLFGTLSTWGLKFSRNANTQLERITSHEKARELLASIAGPNKRDEEIAKFLKALLAQPRG